MVQETRDGVKQRFADLQIPQLPDRLVAIAPRDAARWELPTGAAQHAILHVGAEFELQIVLQNNASPLAAARLLSDIEGQKARSAFQLLELQKVASDRFAFKLTLQRAGRYFFYGQYSLDGQNWSYMRGNPIQLLVYPAQLRGLRMYIMIPNASGPLGRWSEKLASIAAMGFNMVHLLPLTAQGHSQSPYAARELFQVEPSLCDAQDPRTPDAQWQDFVADAQRKGLGLCLDLVVNHVALDSEIVRRCPDWIVPDADEVDGLKRAGYWAADGWEKWQDLVLINYDHPNPEVQQSIWNYFLHYGLYWARFAAASGGMVRLDNLHSTQPLFAEMLTLQIRQAFPHLGILAEYFGTHENMQAAVRGIEIDLLLATPWEHHFTLELRQYLRYLHQTQHELPWFCPLNSHDSGTPAQEFASVLSTRPRYLVSALLGNGATGLSQGVERGLLEKINFIGRNPTLKYAPEQDFRSFFRQINELLASQPAFQQGAAIRFVDRDHSAVIAALRFVSEQDDAPVFLVVASLDIHNAQSLAIDLQEPLLKDRRYRDVLSGLDVHVSSASLLLQLEPCGVRVISASRATP